MNEHLFAGTASAPLERMTADRQSILVPVDLEPASLLALAVAQDLAARLDCEVVALYVEAYPPPALTGLVAAPVPPAEELAAAHRAIRAIADDVQVLERVGDPALEILAAIAELHPRMVVMGTRGKKGLSRALLGSVAETVMRRSTVPVMTVHAPGP